MFWFVFWCTGGLGRCFGPGIFRTVISTWSLTRSPRTRILETIHRETSPSYLSTWKFGFRILALEGLDMVLDDVEERTIRWRMLCDCMTFPVPLTLIEAVFPQSVIRYCWNSIRHQLPQHKQKKDVHEMGFIAQKDAVWAYIWAWSYYWYDALNMPYCSKRTVIISYQRRQILHSTSLLNHTAYTVCPNPQQK